MRLREPELAPAVRGLLVVSWMTQTNFGRPLQVANLLDPHNGPARRTLLTLGDVHLVALADGVLSLSGLQLQRVDGRVVEHSQVWRCTVAQAERAADTP